MPSSVQCTCVDDADATCTFVHPGGYRRDARTRVIHVVHYEYDDGYVVTYCAMSLPGRDHMRVPGGEAITCITCMAEAVRVEA